MIARHEHDSIFWRINDFTGMVTIILLLIGGAFYFGRDRSSVDNLIQRVGQLEQKIDALSTSVASHIGERK
jgi:hypothetical protein